MSYKIPYNNLPNLGDLQAGDIVPGLRPAFSEGSMTIADIAGYILPYQIYRVSMTQVGSTDPFIDHEYENGFGTIVWTYVSTGVYNGNLNGAFVGNFPEQTKVFFNPSMGIGINYYTVFKIDDDNIRIETKNNTWILSDDLLKTTFVDFIKYS